jgi:hypothetical protein
MNENEFFIKKLYYYKENFNLINNGFENSKIWKNFDNYEAQRISKENGDYQFCCLIEISRIKDIINSINNIFASFLELDESKLFDLFKAINNTHLGLIYFKNESERYNYFRNEHKRSNKDFLIKTIEYLEKMDIYFKEHASTITYLKYLKNNTEIPSYNKKNLYQDLFYRIAQILYSNESNYKIVNIVNSIIKVYFDEEEITFSKNTNISKFKKRKYTFGTTQKGITLYHS